MKTTSPPSDSTEPAPDSADHALFRQAMQHVQPLVLKSTYRCASKGSSDAEEILQARRRHAQGLAEGARPHAGAMLELLGQGPHKAGLDAWESDTGHYLQAGYGPDLLRGLKRGKWIPSASLDLHGCTQEQANERLDHFLASCLDQGIRCACIIHGKGMGSRQQPILKTAVRQHLSRLAAVQAWVQCSEPQGGAGAVHVLLRLPRPKRRKTP